MARRERRQVAICSRSARDLLALLDQRPQQRGAVLLVARLGPGEEAEDHRDALQQELLVAVLRAAQLVVRDPRRARRRERGAQAVVRRHELLEEGVEAEAGDVRQVVRLDLADEPRDDLALLLARRSRHRPPSVLTRAVLSLSRPVSALWRVPRFTDRPES